MKSIMNLPELLKLGTNVSVMVTLDDLRIILKEATAAAIPVGQGPANDYIPANDYMSRKEVLALLGIDSSTLWCWEKTGYIKSFPFGGRKRYRREDVEAILTGRKGGRHER